ncbi:RNA polymerase sigma factor [Mesonia sp. K7]|uniref:RNA polymerase sigma factor n=1 Tax=Mesonia sp. K7 TaxID=2218606 RepID=UPI000DA7161D|nr:sigma-70 family RNA polymerase sigma factor [Mesonia sp. K7]PZD79477.1 RNA polymerase subunit sigma-70 [Mesonia sp. K7]
MNKKAFLDFLKPIENKIYRLSLRFLVSKDAAEDATQDIILKLWKNKNKLSTYDSPEAFAMTMTKNHCIDELKRKRNNNLRIVHNNYEDDKKSSLQKQIEVRDEFELVKRAIKNLNEQEQLIIQLRDIEELEYDEIEKISGLKPVNIRVILSRARKKLRQELIKKHNYGTA